MSRTAREEYVARVNSVVDYIDGHLAERLTLEELAAVACFSPFHFHRIFRAMTGETLSQYTRRLRLERAASLLIVHRSRPVTQIAFDCGFTSSAGFARAFKEGYGMSASEWRAAVDDPGAAPEAALRKIRQALRNPGEDVCIAPVYREGTYQPRMWRLTMTEKTQLAGDIEVREEPEFTIAYLRHTGPYKGDDQLFGQLFGRLMQWAGPRGLLGPATKVVTIYHDNPDVTEDDKQRISVAVSVPPETEVSGEIGKMTIPGGLYARARFEVAPDQYQAAWDAVYRGWLPESGYQPADSACYEEYHSDPNQHPEHKAQVSICVPVRPL